jgi:hypothetical protein
VSRRDGEEGAVLVLVLVIVLVGALLTAALAQFGFTNVVAAKTYAGHERLADALDLGLLAAVENLGDDTACGLTLPDADGLPENSVPPASFEPIDDIVTCTPAGPEPDTYAVTVVGYSPQATCPDPGTPSSDPMALQATVVVTTIVDQQIPRISSRELQPATGCLPEPT